MLSIFRTRFVYGAILSICFMSCVTEEDVTTTSVEIEEPQEGEVVLIKGFVRDTSELALSQVSLKAQIGQYSSDITTGPDGYYEIEIPAIAEKGVIIAAKSQYNRTIQTIDPTKNEIVKDLFLLKDLNQNTPNLNVNPNELFRIEGRFIDQFNEPIRNKLVYGLSLYGNDEDVSFSVKTDSEGNFEFVEEPQDFTVHFLFANTYNEPCFDQFFESYIAFEEETLELGDLIFAQSMTKVILTNTTVTDCIDIDFVNHIFQPGGINIIEGLIPSDQHIQLCDYNSSDLPYYNGVKSMDRLHFNGRFQNLDDFSETTELSLCTPTGSFGELRINDQTILFENINYDEGKKMVTLENDDQMVQFTWNGSFGTSSNGNRYDYSRVSMLFSESDDDNLSFQLSTNSEYYVNWVFGREGCGVLTTLVEQDGDEAIVTIRFRV